ncbi:MAG: alpha-N-arabinofuranosidase [Fimbriimonadaceae bacterium]|nr:alpha-N-arabinofuranosidase [Fimbriimonadaceae bacterium]
MKQTTVFLHPDFIIDQVDPRVFGGFLEHLGRAVYEGVYHPESSHADARGFRYDVLNALKRLKFTAMRYPGGNFVSGYDWLDGVGPRELRPTKIDLAWQSSEPNQFGTNEFMEMAREMDWTPMMAVNLGTGTPAEARNWLEYCNGKGGSYWSDLRRSHGYEEPHDIKLWCLGNEMDGPWQIGHVPARDYAVRAQQTARLMKMCDPDVELVLCGSCATNLPTYMQWDREVLEYCYRDVDYLSLHCYVGNESDDTEDFLNCGLAVDQQIEELDAVCAFVQAKTRSKKRVKLSFDEWNVWYRARQGDHVDGRGKFAPPLLEEVYNLEDALVVAQFLNSFIRHADSVKIANLAQIVNVIAPILTQGDEMVLQSIFYPIEMFASRQNGVSLRPTVQGPKIESKSHTAPQIDASAILNGRELSVFLVNRSTTETTDVRVDLAGRRIASRLSAEIVTGSDPKAFNEFGKDPVVCSVPYSDECFDNGTLIVQLPPLSFYAGSFSIA